MGFVYILRHGDEDLFKVGRTRRDLEARVNQHRTSNPSLSMHDVIETEHEVECESFLKGILVSRRHPGGRPREFFALPTAEIEGAIEDARRYATEDVPLQKEADRLAGEESDGRVLKPGDAEWDAYRRLLLAREAKCRIDAEEARLTNELKLAIGTAEGLEGVATWKTQVSWKFNETEFRAKEPAAWEAFRRESRNRRFLPS